MKGELVLSDDMPDVRELKLTKLDPGGAEAVLTLTDNSLVVEAGDEGPLPDWLRGEIPFDDLDIVYVDPAKDQKDEGEGEEEAAAGEEALPPGFRIVRWIEITNEETDETFPRQATMVLDGEHVDLKLAEGFATTFARLAGREKPEEVPAEEAAVEEPVEALPIGAPEPVEAEAAVEETPAFAAAEDDSPAFAPSEAEAKEDDTPAFAAPDDKADDTPAFAAPDDDENS